MSLFTIQIPANAYTESKRLKIYVHAYSGSWEDYNFEGSSSIAFYTEEPCSISIPWSETTPSNSDITKSGPFFTS